MVDGDVVDDAAARPPLVRVHRYHLMLQHSLILRSPARANISVGMVIAYSSSAIAIVGCYEWITRRLPKSK